MNHARTLAISAALTVGCLIPPVASASLITIQDVERNGALIASPGVPLDQALNVGANEAHVSTEVGSALEENVDQILARLMRELQKNGAGILGQIFGMGSNSYDEDRNSPSLGTSHLFDILQIPGLEKGKSNVAAVYGSPSSTGTRETPYIFSTTGNGFNFLPVGNSGSGYSPTPSAAPSNPVDYTSPAPLTVIPSQNVPSVHQSKSPGTIAAAQVLSGPNAAPVVAMLSERHAVRSTVSDSPAAADSGSAPAMSMSLSVIPEPSASVALLFAGGVMALRRRRV